MMSPRMEVVDGVGNKRSSVANLNVGHLNLAAKTLGFAPLTASPRGNIDLSGGRFVLVTTRPTVAVNNAVRARDRA